MHNDDIERADSRDDDAEVNAVIAADDTGMVQQQELLVQSELDEAGVGDVETGVGSEAEGP